MDHVTLPESKQHRLFEPPPELMPWEAAAESDRVAAQIVFNRPLDTVFSYLVPDELRGVIGPGQRVKAPFGKGNRTLVGYCVGLGPVPETSRELKSVEAVLDREPLVSPRMLELTRWIAERYLCGWGQVLDSVIPHGVKRSAGTRIVRFFRPAPGIAERLAELELPGKQRAILELLVARGEPLRVEEITDAVHCGTAPIKGLRDKGLIQASRERTDEFTPEIAPVRKGADLQLNDQQQVALNEILSVLRAGQHKTLLLHGVTGSGKTEVYIQAIREIVGYGRQAIVLVPEISLTPQTIRRFRTRFESVAVLHSHLSDAERHWHWQQIARGGVQVVVGARSAIFAPTPHLGLIVIDEEHETSFKQDTTPRYHAREVARKRAELEGIPLVLGSATPTLESWLRCQEKQDVLISLPKRVEGRPLPPVVIVDVRNDPQVRHGAAIGRVLESGMRVALNDGGQVILFLNLRGFSPTIWCRACGEAVKCRDCDITLTWHKDRNVALCHSCDFQTVIAACPNCGDTAIRYLGTGTQRLEHEVRAKFPQFKCLRMDSDSMRRFGSHDAALEAFRVGDVQILLGTQMIAKGLDFPNVTLVGVISADTVLHQPDLRAAERTFQLIAQVAGRTGRGNRAGRVFVQSSSPTEPAILKAAQHDYGGFALHELRHRREMFAPPYHHLTRVILRGPQEEAVREHAQAVSLLLREVAEAGGSDVRILGPAPAPVAKLKANYRYHIQLAAPRLESIQDLWREGSRKLSATKEVEYQVDVDPINMR
jgi:primosomal protein N' (replication factor Y)